MPTPNPETRDPKPLRLTPKQAARLKILDPACGSGSFLIGAYQYLLDWHLKRYTEHGEPAKLARGKDAVLRPGPDGAWRLSTRERKRILLDNIHGVDIDYQAVEVTKLALLLKCLEGETAESLGGLWSLFRERALPDLGRNIQCGNSLIGTDICQSEAWREMSEEERRRVNPFDYEREFPAAFKQGGFDAVIGNPPYVRIQTITDQSPATSAELKRRYRAAGSGSFDLYVLFIEAGLRLLSQQGKFGMILPAKFTNSDYGGAIREIITKSGALEQLVDFGSAQIFDGATTYTCLLFLQSRKGTEFVYERAENVAAWQRGNHNERGTIALDGFGEEAWTFRVGINGQLAKKLDRVEPKLAAIADVFVGVQTSADSVYILDVVDHSGPQWRVSQKGQTTVFDIESSALLPIVSGTDVKRYRALAIRQSVIFPYAVANDTAMLRTMEEIREKMPKLAMYLAQHRRTLEARERGKFADGQWYRFGRNQNLGIQGRVKICVPRLVERLCAAMDADGGFCLDNVDVNGVTLKAGETRVSLQYLLGILNSRLIGWYFPFISAPFRGNWRSANRQFLDRVPIWLSPERDFQKRLESLVDQMLLLHKQLGTVRLPQGREQLQREIDATDREIDRVVYELYGLTEEEVRIVEEATG